MNKKNKRIYAKLAVIALITVYAGLSVASALATKLSCGPDEPAHFIYVREIGEHFNLPELSHAETHDISLHSSHEAHQPPLYYTVTAIPYYIARSFGADIDTTWLIVRLFNVLIGAGWVYFIYRLAREVLKRHFAALAAAFVGLLPLSTYIGGVVNNDVMISLLFTAALWMIIKSVRHENITKRDSIITGIFSGLAILSKSQGLFLIPIILASAIVIARRNGVKKSSPAFMNSIIAILIALLISSLWFIRNRYVYGSFMIQSLNNPLIVSGNQINLFVWIVIARLVTIQLFNNFWTPYWLISDFINTALYQNLLLVLCGLILIGVLLHFRTCRSQKSTKLDCRLDIWGLMALPGVLIYIFLFRHTLWVDKGALQQGRLLLPAAGVLGIAAVIALKALVIRPVSMVTLRILNRTGHTGEIESGKFQRGIEIVFEILLILGLLIANLSVLHATVAYYQIH